MGKIVMPKNSALLNEIEAVLQIYYNAGDWLANEDYKAKLKEMIGSEQYESSYTKKAQITSYFGFTVSRDIHTKSITASGKVMYEAILSNNTSKIQEVLMAALETVTFGRNNDGCPDCDSDIEPPALFIRASLDLGYLTYKEFAYLLWKLEDKGANYTDSISEIRTFRTSGQVNLGEEAKKYTDAKPIMILSNTNNDNDKKLFRSMIAMIEFEDNKTIDKQFYFGTDKFETVWEKLIDKFFGVPKKEVYFPHAQWTERYGKNKGKPASALEPDSIMIYKSKYYVLDAKYYRYGVFPQFGPSVLPQSSDINKQITYGQFVKNRKVPAGAQVFNAFLMPYNKVKNWFGISGTFGNVAEAIGDWVDNPAAPEIYERVQGIVIDTRYLLKNYDGNHDSDKEELSSEIEKVLTT